MVRVTVRATAMISGRVMTRTELPTGEVAARTIMMREVVSREVGPMASMVSVGEVISVVVGPSVVALHCELSPVWAMLAPMTFIVPVRSEMAAATLFSLGRAVPGTGATMCVATVSITFSIATIGTGFIRFVVRESCESENARRRRCDGIAPWSRCSPTGSIAAALRGANLAFERLASQGRPLVLLLGGKQSGYLFVGRRAGGFELLAHFLAVASAPATLKLCASLF